MAIHYTYEVRNYGNGEVSWALIKRCDDTGSFSIPALGFIDHAYNMHHLLLPSDRENCTQRRVLSAHCDAFDAAMARCQNPNFPNAQAL